MARSSEDVIEAKSVHVEGPGAVALVDVRSPEEYAGGYAHGATNVPLADLAGGWATGLPEDKHTPIVTICKVGERSLYGMLLLKAMGYQSVQNVRGGLDAWIAAGLPTDTP